SPDTYVNWIVKWVDDSGGLQENPPEYYFIAGVEGTSETLTSSRNNEDLIKVYEWSLMCLGVNHCADYSEGAFCRYDLCNVGENSAPKKITCGETFNPITGCNESTNCGCDWNVGLGVCESEWSSESDCPAGTLEIGTCSYTENSEDTCDDDGLLTRSLTALWEWSPLNPTHSDPSGVEDKCINVQEILPCPASAQVPFFGIYQLVIVITILGLIYLLTHKKQIKNKRRKKKNK
ncbi:MAG: hypothetical protein NTZ83_02960, partial [Candidatus Pacearchaeota archaeon]|nr:hypothetical protein [Candidatus Pacearchaeota archaeon]